MCARFVVKSDPAEIREQFRFPERPNRPARWNVAPTDDVLIVRRPKDGDGREAAVVRWGLVPFWAKDVKIGVRMINARCEEAEGKPAFRESFQKRRCLIPADGFYEWRPEGKIRQPYYFTGADGRMLALAGLWARWRDPAGNKLDSCTILTTEPNAVAAQIHDRMPVLLEPEDWDAWLQDADAAARLLCRTAPPDRLVAVPVATTVNSVKNDGPELILPIGPALQ